MNRVTYWKSSPPYITVIRPAELKPLEANQEALRALVIAYSNTDTEAH